MDTPVPVTMVPVPMPMPTSLNPILIPHRPPIPRPISSPARTLDAVLVSKKDKVPLPLPPASSWMLPLQREMSEIRESLRAQPQASDIRLLIFASAASSQEHEKTLVPVPPQFQASPGAGCQVDRLRHSVADNWPSCRLMLDILGRDEQYADLTPDDREAIHLLHWLLVATPSSPTLRRMSGLHLRRLCKVLGLARPTLEPGHLLSISYETDEQQESREHGMMMEHRASYAFLGLPFNHLYRFLATGNLEHPPGEPIRLYAQPEAALVHCEELAPQQESQQEQQEAVQSEEQQQQPAQSSPEKGHKLCWGNSILSNQQKALVICQLPAELDESIAHLPEKHFLEYFVQESVGLKPCYLLLFDEPVAAKLMLAWPGRRIEVENKGPSLAQRSRGRILGWTRYLGHQLEALKRALSSL
ncbi:uncharacterized protein LOC128260850 [Drosophila gunungcola]|uniref:PARP16 N-terminal domain-containing protein n=1 Tax=Drosophila gunungcola TaxID=103775 RepID=A0A9Q0BKH2_9MUSC|nr:uncharacterized protein LOC128260850 [Drosophila gunungcola]KAI8035211.1 hypothetical protein M5D96_012022 [Drosophila gunungcola]